MNPLIRGLTWPVIALLVVGGTHLVAEALRPELQEFIGPAVVMPIHLVAGGWAAYGTLRAGGTFVHGLVAGAILGLLPVALQLVGFGLILGRDPGVTTTTAIFGLITIFWGGALGAGIASAFEARVGEAAPAVGAVGRLSGEARSS
jgi:hypothetical protein